MEGQCFFAGRGLQPRPGCFGLFAGRGLQPRPGCFGRYGSYGYLNITDGIANPVRQKEVLVIFIFAP